MEFVKRGLLEKIPNNKRYYTELTTDILEDFLLEISKPTKSYMNALTGKAGAIQAHLSLTEKILEKLGKSKEEIEKKLQEERLKLEQELHEGMYQISTDPSKDYIKEIDYEDRW